LTQRAASETDLAIDIHVIVISSDGLILVIHQFEVLLENLLLHGLVAIVRQPRIRYR
jgi:hypothetical protein